MSTYPKCFYNTHANYSREDGPAIEYEDGSQYWYRNGVRHREDGPAIIDGNGNKAWFINGKQLTEEEFTLLTFFKQEDE